jgi:hypothetical protein
MHDILNINEKKILKMVILDMDNIITFPELWILTLGYQPML